MEKREKIVPVRVSLKEEETLIKKAEKIGLKLSTYLRLAGLEK
jgi:hypothetical protein